MPTPLERLGDLSVHEFLATYWQRKPLLIRGLFQPWKSPLSPDDLLELATHDDAISRLILTGGGHTELYLGPLEADDLSDLDADDEWTVLVQEVDRLLPQVADVLSRFRFIPNWRLDDVMVSYATAGSGVGAHTDQYDVFLIQGSGRRRWEIESTPRENPVWREDSEVAVLAEFSPDMEWVLEPGDVLYLPPLIPHNGVALEPCLTLSVGFRAPTTSELLTGVLTYAAEASDDGSRYADPGLAVPKHPGHFPPAAREALRRQVRRALEDETAMDEWLARYVSEPIRGSAGTPPDRWLPWTTIRSRLAAGAELRAAVHSQTVYVERSDDRATLYVAGLAYPDVPLGLVQALTGSEPADAARLSFWMDDEEAQRQITNLVNAGAFVIA